MFIYIFFLLLFLLAALIDKKGWFSLLCIFVLFLITIFRADVVGLDTIVYIRQGMSEWATGLKTRQFIYAFLTSLMTESRSHLLIVTFAILTFWGILVSSRRFCVRPAAAFFFFILFEYYNLSLNIARIYAAIGLLLIAYSYLFENNNKKYLFFPLVFLATGFHTASYVCFPLFFCRYLDFSKVKQWLIVVIFTSVYLLFQLVLKDQYLLLMHTLELTEDIEAYSLYFNQAEDAGLSIGGIIIAASSLVISIYIFLSLSREKSEKARILTSLFFVSIIFDIFFADLFGTIGRLRYPIDIINIITYSYYFFKIKDKNKVIVILLVAVFYGYEFYYLISGDAYQTVPYKFDFWLI